MCSYVIMRIWCMGLVGAFLCAGCKSHQLPPREQVKAHLEAMHEAVGSQVPDEQRAERLNKAIDALGAQLLSFEALLNTLHTDVQALNARPHATRAEFETLLEQFNRQRVTTRTRVAELHFEMIAATTAKEWQGLARYERAALTASEH
jgi:Spy/CpxP family protein refolding chaperone